MNELISVVVPVYEVEPFIEHCISSITSQTYRNLEIILVDDGSSDNCPEICDTWEQKDKRVRVLHQMNGGGGKARNQALDIARGEFIAFVDSDDYIAPIMFEFLHDQFTEDVDIVECTYRMTKDDYAKFDDFEVLYSVKSLTAEEAMRENITDHIFRQLIWNKMYRRNVIADIRFPVGKKIDDEFWTYQVIGNARKLVHTDKILYAYRQQEDSVMHSLSMDERFQALEAKVQRHEYICRRMPKLVSDSICNLWFTCIYQGQLLLRTMDNRADRKESWIQLKRILDSYPIKKMKLSVSVLQRIWLRMASVSLEGTCIIRNLLKIGL